MLLFTRPANHSSARTIGGSGGSREDMRSTLVEFQGAKRPMLLFTRPANHSSARTIGQHHPGQLITDWWECVPGGSREDMRSTLEVGGVSGDRPVSGVEQY
ncbi:hypothetical protein SKAU_G00421350 [Synaphobranchus kaupii]|uniref:Uncharacterized protein n=1 Tax=Synaphobranchus kaupii TaxID=118154 RepID=A0A9Q1IB75_SYNKA|nr:hypothetical protein SKAU_G00421350 [Synaphobranchus kaupii]